MNGSFELGTCYHFKCHCGYEAEVSGGEDVGFSVRICTMTCGDCRALVDVVVGPPMPDMPLEDDLMELIGKCPECKGANVKRWPKSYPCPKCNSRIQQGEPTISWD
jgi:hypothetical protein